MNIVYINEDATYPVSDGQQIIIHCCNTVGKWGKGFVMALSKRWSEPEQVYRKAEKYTLGDVQFVQVESNITVANIIAQDGIYPVGGVPPIRYTYLTIGLLKVRDYALKLINASIHCPKIGAGLAGGDWSVIAQSLEDVFSANNIPVTVYLFKP